MTESLRFVCVGLIVELFACDHDRYNSEKVMEEFRLNFPSFSGHGKYN